MTKRRGDFDSVIKVQTKELRQNLLALMHGNGIEHKVAACILENLMDTELRGHSSHGLIQIPVILDKLKAGLISGKANYRIISDHGAVCMVDGLCGMGYYIANIAMERCINKACEFGIGIVTVKNSSHFGSAGYYTSLAVRKGLVAVSMSNSRPLVAPSGSRRAILGTNPISIGFPRNLENGDRFLLDMSTSVVSHNTVKQYANNQEAVPSGWGIDRTGHPTTDPKKILDGGALLPIEAAGGAYKGLGLSIAIELFCALLSGGLASVEMERDDTSSCHTFMVINPDFFVGVEALIQHCSYIFQCYEEEESFYTPGSKLPHDSGEITLSTAVYDSIFSTLQDFKP
ncbi:Ldh family oxidoreductase [Paenibacillus humicus]|uniref:Ldh family oxidoreductase n=1 Tax=Paenibacillus humicus TaxID=412861 RepID=UPI0013E2C9C1|nr:Ldh family oxidoreductase [Paenibacillus humicus]